MQGQRKKRWYGLLVEDLMLSIQGWEVFIHRKGFPYGTVHGWHRLIETLQRPMHVGLVPTDAGADADSRRS